MIGKNYNSAESVILSNLLFYQIYRHDDKLQITAHTQNRDKDFFGWTIVPIFSANIRNLQTRLRLNLSEDRPNAKRDSADWIILIIGLHHPKK